MENRRNSRSSSSNSRTGGKQRRDRGSARPRSARPSKYTLPPDVKIEYKNLALLQRFTTERGKIVSRRLSGLNAHKQREMGLAIKWARYLGLLPVGAKRRQ
ncbi:MAG: 30S ribosomal protein S18 [Candidatus Omnitrophota bacterium]|nr:30S ribosomal protein S18 [Candidatus Omnitrophota bacterium]MDZ4242416.1 30S ribosomal protein S18 [Candidatus Omnitrophota bacterium]